MKQAALRMWIWHCYLREMQQAQIINVPAPEKDPFDVTIDEFFRARKAAPPKIETFAGGKSSWETFAEQAPLIGGAALVVLVIVAVVVYRRLVGRLAVGALADGVRAKRATVATAKKLYSDVIEEADRRSS